MGPKLVNCCRPEQMGTKEFGKRMKRIQILEEGRVPAKVREKNKRIARKEYRRLLYNFEMDGSMAQTGLQNLAKGEHHEGKRRVA